MGEILGNLATGFVNAVQPLNFLMIVVGLAIGIIAGALPGITMLNSIVLVLPFTYLMGIVPALLLMIGVYCGGVFGGSITGILFNIPGDPMNVPTTWEGYRMSRQGHTQYALGLAIMSSAFGGLVSALFLAFFAPPFARFALSFSSVAFSSVVVVGLASVSVLGQSSMAAALVSLFSGMFLGTIGTEAQYGVERFAFGIPFLKTGVDFVTVLIGLFAIGEVLDQIVGTSSEPAAETPRARAVPRLPLLALWPLRGPLVRGTAVGIAVGGLAGAGATVSSFVSYGLEKQISRTPELFGTGHAGGLVASESSVNGSTGGAMIHLLTLGIPGSAATAVMMGAFLLHGIQPGPLLFTRQTAEVYTIVAGMILANVLMIGLGFLAALSFAMLMKVPPPILNTFIVVFCFLGAFAATLMGLGLGGAFVAGLLGVGGAIVMIPLLLYVPPLVDVGMLSVKAVAGVTMVQVLVAATSGMLAHRRRRAVNAELAWVGGVAMASGSLVGALASYYVYDRWLLLIFALMVTAAGALMIVPVEAAAPSLPIGEPRRFSRPLTATVCGSVGVGAGLVGAGGAFLLVPLLLAVVGVPIRVTIGSSLAITALSSSMGVVGKLVTDQIPYESALVVAIGAVPGAHLGAALSRRLSGSQLRLALGLIIVVIAVRVWWDVLTYH